ncbi:MAG: Nif3-like dinuclear metal center hexameric protein [Planctomyces sp.]|nr:Nif3-like dinuclear metal center hexameric protein [Planctomyces sp.]
MSQPAITVGELADVLDQLAPAFLAESWDNVGLLLGDRAGPVRCVMTCLTLTEDVAAEAAGEQVDLVVTHHPLLFKAAKRITSETPEGRTLLTLMGSRIAVYSPHTAFDSSHEGINEQLAAALGLAGTSPLRPATAGEHEPSSPRAGGGRFGTLDQERSLSEFLALLRERLPAGVIGYTGELSTTVRRVAVACGAAAEFLEDAAARNCHVLVTGEARFHACLEARARGIALVLAGHYATERPGVEWLAEQIGRRFPPLTAWASRVETDPLQWSLP